MKIVVQKRVSAADLAIQKILAEMKVHSTDYWEDFDGDYKDAAVIEEALFLDTCDHLGFVAVSEVDAYSCPRSWRVKLTTPDGSWCHWPVRD